MINLLIVGGRGYMERDQRSLYLSDTEDTNHYYHRGSLGGLNSLHSVYCVPKYFVKEGIGAALLSKREPKR